jgi:hypothetical protein
MKSIIKLLVGSVGLMSFACSAGDPSQDAAQGTMEEVGSTEGALCANQAGTGAIQASLAVAAANELHRWNAPVDFQWNTSTAMLELSSTGKSRCADKVCRNVSALLALQSNAAHHQVYFQGGVVLDAYTLRGVLQSHFQRQKDCNAGKGDYVGNACTVEAHDLWFDKKSPGTCEMDNYFWANKAGVGGSVLKNPERLAYQLYFAGYPDNPFLNFRNYTSNVAIDPTIGLTEGSSTSSGSCAAVCTQYSKTSVSGQCCSCNGVTKTFSRSLFSADMYLCR